MAYNMIVYGDFLLTRERSSEGTDPLSHYLIHRIDFVSALGSAIPLWAPFAPKCWKENCYIYSTYNVLHTSKPWLFSSALSGLTSESPSPEAFIRRFNISLHTTTLKLETKHQSQPNNLMAFLWQNL